MYNGGVKGDRIRLKHSILVIIAGLLLLRCSSTPSEPKEYIHSKGGFKITLPAGWIKTSEDNEMFEFRARGYSNKIDALVIVDMIIMIDRANARGYLFAAQIAESGYQKIKTDIESVIASFKSV